ncbi:MAG: DUF6152 family protein [Candidatus Rariloculaceae bacterium]
MFKRLSRILLFSIVLTSFGVAAHHSRNTFFDMSQTVELEGEITRVQWRHPHVRYWIQADAAYGGAEWEMETTPPSILERYGIDPEVVGPGTRVRVAGPPSRFKENVMEVSHFLLPDGREVLLHTGIPPRWSDDTIERAKKAFSEEAIRAAEATANGIYRVWSREPMDARQPFWLDSYPLTDAARATAATWDPVVEVNTGCRPKAMPRIMGSSWPIQFIDEGTQIRLLQEEFDTVRIIHLDEDGPGSDVTPSLWGYSTGRWDGDELVVSTSHMDSYYFGTAGIQLSPDAVVEERFILSADQRLLDYAMTVTDPATFTEPVTQINAWYWEPGETVKLYDCVETPGSWSESPD